MTAPTEEWTPLPAAVASLGQISGLSPEQCRLRLAEWLRDGLVKSAATKVVEHAVISGDRANTVEEIFLSGAPIPAWDIPTTVKVHGATDLPTSFWTPVPSDIGDVSKYDFWATARMTCASGDGTRARREYVGIQVSRLQLDEAIDLYDMAKHDMPPTPRRLRNASNDEVYDWAKSAVAKGYGVRDTKAALDDLWDQNLSRLDRESARDAIKAALAKEGLPTAPGKRKSSHQP